MTHGGQKKHKPLLGWQQWKWVTGRVPGVGQVPHPSTGEAQKIEHQNIVVSLMEIQIPQYPMSHITYGTSGTSDVSAPALNVTV